MNRETKEKIFLENIDLPKKVFNYKYKTCSLNDKDDIIQEGIIALWRGINEGKVFTNGIFDKKKAFMHVWSYEGAYIRTKIGNDKRVKCRENVTYESLDFTDCEGIKDEALEHEVSLNNINCRSAEDLALEKYNMNNFFNFFKNVDKYCNMNRDFYNIAIWKLDGIKNIEIAKKINRNQSIISKRLNEMYDLYIETIA